MSVGDLVQLYDLSHEGPLITGVLIGWDNPGHGWIVLVGGSLEIFSSSWWKCRAVNESR
jgi:hypothetical protein